MADIAAARGRDYAAAQAAAAANYAGHYHGLLEASTRASQQFGWHHLPPAALHQMQGKPELSNGKE